MDGRCFAVDAWLAARAPAPAINKVIGDCLPQHIAEAEGSAHRARKADLRLDQWVSHLFAVGVARGIAASVLRGSRRRSDHSSRQKHPPCQLCTVLEHAGYLVGPGVRRQVRRTSIGLRADRVQRERGCQQSQRSPHDEPHSPRIAERQRSHDDENHGERAYQDWDVIALERRFIAHKRPRNEQRPDHRSDDKPRQAPP